MNRKTIALIVLNLAAAAAVGLIVGLFYKYVLSDEETSAPQEENAVYIESVRSQESEDAVVGVAAVFSDGDTLVLVDSSGYTGDLHASMKAVSGLDDAFPMMSVMKFHQALAVCGWLRENGLSLDAEVKVTPDMLAEDTWSPMRDEHPLGGSFSWRELLTYTLAFSDNNACDILFSLTGGPEYTDGVVRFLSSGDFRIECTEADMHAAPSACLRNWTTPLSAVLLLEKFHIAGYYDSIWTVMSGCRTGMSRIPARISGKASEIIHKTGTGDRTPDGRQTAINDIGIVVLPDGSHFSLAVFVFDAACSPERCEEIIAGTEKKFAQMVREQKSTIYIICYMFADNRTEADDLVQEVLVNLWKGFHKFEGRSDIRTWVYRVSLNTCISSTRKKSLKTIPLTMDIDLFDENDADNRQVNLLHSRISRLQPFDRAIVLLWLENLSYEEIGQIVGISTKNVSVRLLRIKEQLKSMSND